MVEGRQVIDGLSRPFVLHGPGFHDGPRDEMAVVADSHIAWLPALADEKDLWMNM